MNSSFPASVRSDGMFIECSAEAQNGILVIS